MKKMYLCVALVVSAFLVRAVVFEKYLALDNRYWQVDTTTYEKLAQKIAVGERFVTDDGAPQVYRLPGYPFFMGMLYKIFGHNHRIVLWVQIILASFIPLLIFFLCGVIFPERRRVGWIAAWVTVFHVGYVLYSGFMMTETLFVALFLLFLILFLGFVLGKDKKNLTCCDKGDKDHRNKSALKFFNLTALNPAAKGAAYIQFYDELIDQDFVYTHCVCNEADGDEIWRLFGAGVFLGLASLVRPVGHYVLVVALIVLALSHRKRVLQWAAALVLAVGWLVIVGGWLARNAAFFGHIFFHTLPGGHFLYLSAARVVAAEQNISYQNARDDLRAEVQEKEEILVEEKGRRLNEFEVCKLHEGLALDVFKKYPLTTFTMWAKDVVRTTLSLYSAEVLYLESGREHYDYFATVRPLSSWFNRYLKPQTEKVWLKFLIWSEIFFHALLLILAAIFAFKALKRLRTKLGRVFLSTAPFVILFFVIALAGGYARMRLPVEFFLIIWGAWLVGKKA